MFDDSEVFKLVMEAEDRASEIIKGVGEHLAHVAEIGAGFTLGAIGYAAIRDAVGGIEDLGKSLIETNATAEQLQQTFMAIYQSGPEAQQAMGWLTQFAMNAPFTREQIQKAGVTIASLGLDITEVLPALGNLAGVMGTDMPTAAQAFMDAFEGRFQMMARDLHVNKEELVQYGLQIEKNGHVVQSTLAPAFEAFVAARYPNGMALQMETFNGQMSNLVDHLQLIERTVGGAMFKELEGSLKSVISYMNAHQSEILGIATVFGQDLAGGMRAVGDGVAELMRVIPPTLATIEGAWQRLHGVVAAVGTGINAVQSGIGNYLGQVVLPLVQTSLGYIIHFWDEHGKAITTILQGLGNNIQRFLAFVASNFTSYLSYLKGVTEVGWGAIEIVVGGALELLSGNLDGFGKTWDKGWREIWDGATVAVEGASEIMIRVVASAFEEINKIEHQLYNENANGKGPFQWLYDSIAAIEDPVIHLVHAVFQPIFDAINQLMHTLHDLSTSGAARWAGLPSNIGWDKNTNLTMQSPEAAIAAVKRVADSETHPLGWASNVGLTTIPVDQAIARLRAVEKQILDQNAAEDNNLPTFTAAKAQKQGKDAFDAFITGLKDLGKSGLTLPNGVDVTALLGGNVKSLPAPGFSADDVASAVTKAITGGPYGVFAANQQAQYGSTIAAYGLGPQQSPLAQLVAHLRQQLANDERTIAALTQQNALLMQMTGLETRTERNTAKTADSLDAIARKAGTPVQAQNPLTAHGLQTAGRK